jgi:hypothetical protein
MLRGPIGMTVIIAVVLRRVRPALVGVALAVAALSAGPAAANIDVPAVGNTSGEPASQACDDGSYMVGVEVKSGDLLDSIAPRCAPMAADGTFILPPKTMPWFGGYGGSGPRDYDCGDPNAVVGRIEIIMTTGSNPSIDNLKLYCRTLAGEMLSVVPILTNDHAYHSNQDAPAFQVFDCSFGRYWHHLPRGITGTRSSVINSLGVLCASSDAAPPPPAAAPTPSLGARLPDKNTDDAVMVNLDTLIAAGASFHSMAQATWPDAGRAAQAICDHLGYRGGFFTGNQTVYGSSQYQAVCAGTAWLAPVPMVLMPGAADGAFSSYGWFEATHDASLVCDKALQQLQQFNGSAVEGTAYGVLTGRRYLGVAGNDGFEALCFTEAKDARLYRVTGGEAAGAGASGNLASLPWAQAARAADALCHRQGSGFVGGFFDGDIASNGNYDLVCVGIPPPLNLSSNPSDTRSKVHIVLGGGTSRIVSGADAGGVSTRIELPNAPPSDSDNNDAGTGGTGVGGGHSSRIGKAGNASEPSPPIFIPTGKLGKLGTGAGNNAGGTTKLATVNADAFAGSWRTTINGTARGTMTLVHLHDTWAGTYTALGVTGSISQGRILANGHLSFKWTNPGDVVGHGDFALTGPDSFTGTFTFDAKPGDTGSWTGQRQ